MPTTPIKSIHVTDSGQNYNNPLTEVTFPRDIAANHDAMALEYISRAYGGWYARAVAHALGVKKTAVFDWWRLKRIPRKHRAALRAFTIQTADAFIKAAQNIEIDNTPPRKRGMYVVRDHGDGLPPHNSTANTLRALGLEPKAKLGKPLPK